MSKCYIVPSSCVLWLQGKDAVRYLNARLTCDVKRLPEMTGTLGAALTPQGRTEAFFNLIRLSSEEFVLVSSGVPSRELTEPLLRYRVADRVTVADRSEELVIFHVPGPCSIGDNDLQVRTPNDVFRINEQVILYAALRSQQWGWDIVAPLPLAASFADDTSSSPEEDGLKLKNLRVQAGIPAFPDEIRVGGLFQEAGVTRAISPQKGCFVGQEVVEKVDARGRLPRMLVHFVGTVSCVVGDEVMIDSAEVGEVVSVVESSDSQSVWGFALVRTQYLLPSSQLDKPAGALLINIGNQSYTATPVPQVLDRLYSDLAHRQQVASNSPSATC